MSTAETGNGKPGETVELMEDYLIPEYILNGEDTPANVDDMPIPRWPVLVFVNSLSGGQLGVEIIPHLRALLHPKQVFDLQLAEEKPQRLDEFLKRLDSLEGKGDALAKDIKDRLRLIVAGGDGTHGWLLGAVGDLNRKELPPIATIPLGTGNNLPYSFGWGKKNPPTTVAAMREILQKTAEAKPMPVDRWDVVIRLSKTVEECPLKEMPSDTRSKFRSRVRKLNEVKSFQHVSDENANFEAGRHSYHGSFWNYLSIGMDSEVAYAFHNLRHQHPEKFKNQFMNQCRYASLACTQGWFCASCLHPRSKNINTLANFYISKKIDGKWDGKWDKLRISPSIRSILVLNLPSFSGGMNPWGTPGKAKSEERGLTAPFVNDGLIEIVGFRDGWHGVSLVIPPHHGTRLAQAHRVKVEFHKGGVDHTFMRVDGEPWLQNLPDDDHKPTVMEIIHKGQAVALAYGQSISQPLPKDEADKGQLHRYMSTASFSSVQEAPLERGSSHRSVKQSIREEPEAQDEEASVKQSISEEGEVQQEEASVSGTG